MVGLDDKDDRILIIENKLWAPLTKNQPTAYIKQLATDKPALLLFIAPKDYMSTLWQELKARCAKDNASGLMVEETASPFQVLVLDANRNHRLALTSWDSLFDALTQKVNNSAALEDVRQLQSLCAGRPAPSDPNQYKDLLDELVTRLVRSGFIVVDGYKAVRMGNYYRRYMSINGLTNWCVEYNESYFDQIGPSRFWLVKYATRTDPPDFADMLKKLPVKYHKQGKSVFIPLKTRKGAVTSDEISCSLQVQIAEIADQLHQ